jgi:predicted nucleic acid-binding protein
MIRTSSGHCRTKWQSQWLLRLNWPRVRSLRNTPREAAARQARLQEVESTLDPIRFDGAAVRSYGLVVATIIGEGRRPRGRFADLLIPASAHASGLDLYTRNGDDFLGIDHLVRVVEI